MRIFNVLGGTHKAGCSKKSLVLPFHESENVEDHKFSAPCRKAIPV